MINFGICSCACLNNTSEIGVDFCMEDNQMVGKRGFVKTETKEWDLLEFEMENYLP